MDEQSARTLVAETIAGMQRQYGFSAFRDVAAAAQGGGSAADRLEHLIVDAHGVLLVSAIAWPGAKVRGTSADDTWTVARPTGVAEVHPNPIRSHDRQLATLRSALSNAGWELADNELRSLVVFVDTDTSQLELEPLAAMSVAADVGQLRDRYAERVAGYAAGAALSDEATTRLAEAVSRLKTQPAAPASAVLGTMTEPGRPVAVVGAGPNGGSKSQAGVPVIAIALGAILAFGLAIGGVVALVNRPSEFRSAPLPAIPSTPTPEAQPSGTPAAVVPDAESEKPAKVDVALARRRLKEAEPGVYSAIINAEDPRIIQPVEGQVTYEWDYMIRSSSAAVTAGKVSITLDADGNVVGTTR